MYDPGLLQVVPNDPSTASGLDLIDDTELLDDDP